MDQDQIQAFHDECNRYLALPLTILGQEYQAFVQRWARRAYLQREYGGA